MDTFRLPLFPEGSLSASVITTVFIGVCIICFFNLRLGWTFSGLVVPGYLVPMFIAKPYSGAVVCAEGVVSYLIVWFLSERVSRLGWWCSFFGRDRFFALVLASIGVRLLGDMWLLPLAGEWVNSQFGMEFDYHNNLHSYGLIVVALLANQLWKPGLVRGLSTFAVTLGLTYVIVRYGLMEFTNFNIGNLQYMYEDIAASLLASPKAYIILVTTAFLASRMNLHYSWEFNGILIPALLALQWYEPLKILTTVIESAVIYLLAVVLLRAPILRERSFEGAQKLLLFFSIGFAWKMLLGFVLPRFWPDIHVSDYYGFGYMLTTLLAMKAHDKGIVVRMASATFQISIVGAVAGSLIGFALTLVPWPWTINPAPASVVDEHEPPPARLRDALAREKLALYERRGQPEAPLPRAAERYQFARGLRELLAYVQNLDPDHLRRARAQLHAIGYRVERVEARYLCLVESTPRRGWGFYVLALESRDGLAIEVPAPLAEWATAEAGLVLFRELKGRALALGGSGRASDVLRQPRTLYQTFHEVLAASNVLQVRASTSKGSNLWVKTALPAGLDLAHLRKQIGEFDIHWRSAPGRNLQAENSNTEFAELFLDRATRRSLMASLLDPPGADATGRARQRAGLERVHGRLHPWLLASRERIARSGTNLYQPTTQQELLLFDEEVLTPLLRTIGHGWGHDDVRGELEAIAAAAAQFRYRLIWLTDPVGSTDYLILAEPDRLPRRHWGTYVFRVSGAKPFAIGVPWPLFEHNSFEYGMVLFERLRARALLIHGAHPDANQDRTADVLNRRNKLNLFSLASQVLLREAQDEPLMIVQSRAFSIRRSGVSSEADALLAVNDGATTRRSLSPLGKEVLAALEKDRLKVTLVDGSAETMGYEANTVPQVSYLPQSRNKELALVWLSPLARSLYRQQIDNRIQDSHFRAVNIPTITADLYEHLARMKVKGSSRAVPAKLKHTVERYIAAQDVVVLHELRTKWPGVRFQRVIDESTQQAFLVITAGQPAGLAVANLGAIDRDKPTVRTGHGLKADEIRGYVDSRGTWLEFGVGP